MSAASGVPDLHQSCPPVHPSLDLESDAGAGEDPRAAGHQPGSGPDVCHPGLLRGLPLVHDDQRLHPCWRNLGWWGVLDRSSPSCPFHAQLDRVSSPAWRALATTVLHESQVIFRMTSVIAKPITGSPTGAPSATTTALPTTPSETKPSTRA